MLEHSTLTNEVNLIVGQGSNPVHFLYTCSFILPNGKTIAPIKLISLDIVRDYSANFSDHLILEVAFGVGSYTQEVYPHRENLKVTIQREYIGEVVDTVDLDQAVETQEYRAILLDMRDHGKEAKSHLLDTPELGDLAGITRVQFQLIDAATEWLRSVAVGGVFRKASPGEVLRTVLAIESENMPIERQDTVDNVDMVLADNLTKRDHIVVPHGTLLTTLPSFLQEKCGGIYNSDIGFYLQNNNWYVWPLYNTKRFEESPNGLTVINIPENRLPGIERTYRQTSNQLVILCTGQTRSVDTSSGMQLDFGNGIRFSDASALFDSFAETVDNVTTLSRGKNVTELAVRKATTGLNHVVNTAKKVSGNLFAELSKLSFRQGQMIQVTWENSRNDLIYPGMPVRYMYETNGQTYERKGVVVIAQHYIHMHGEGLTSRRFLSNSNLSLFVEMDNEVV